MKDEATRELCWTCGNLYHIGGAFCCRKCDLIFQPGEVSISECKEVDNARDKIVGQAINLWKLLALIREPVALHSLPPSMIGSLGVLVKYNLAQTISGTVESKVMDLHSNSVNVVTKFVVVI
jgi:hypothetical protein